MIFVILVLYVLAIMLAIYMQKKLEARRETEHERRQQRFERLMDVLKKMNRDRDAQVSNSSTGRIETTEDDERTKS